MPASTRFDDAREAGPRVEPAAHAGRGEHATGIERRHDDELRRAEHEALAEHAAVRGIDELRKERELEQRDLGIEHRPSPRRRDRGGASAPRVGAGPAPAIGRGARHVCHASHAR